MLFVDKAVAYLVRGEVAASFASLEIGIAERVAVRAVADAYAIRRRVEKLLATTGDLGTTAQKPCERQAGRPKYSLHPG